MKDQIYIGLMLPTVSTYERGVLHGIANFAQDRPRWRIRLEPPDGAGLSALVAWKPKGWIIRFGQGPLNRRLASLRQPVVNVGFNSTTLGSAGVGNNDEAIGRLAASHLLERRAKTFGYVSWPGHPLTESRGGAFAHALAGAGQVCMTFPGSKSLVSGKEQAALAQWLAELPKPAALFALGDTLGRLVMELCRDMQFRIPEDVAVLGVDNEDPFSRLIWPGLSSIIVPAEQIGYEAAQRLDRLLAGKKLAKKNLLFPPLGIVARGSTRLTYMEDAKIARVLVAIEESSERRISINQLARLVSLSRRSLERRFYRTMGHTLLKEIDRVRLTRARQLLVDTSLPLKAIAAQSGFTLPQRLIESFRRNLKSTPGDYRRKMQK